MEHPEIVIAAGMDQVHHRWAATVAKEKHYFEEEGIKKFQIITTNHNDDNLGLALMKGEVNFGLDARTQSMLGWVSKLKADIFIIGGYKTQFNQTAIGAKQIKSIHDLKGKRIGVSTGKSDARVGLDAGHARIMVKSIGLDPDKDVTWVSGVRFHPVLGDPIGELKKGEADCVLAFDTEVPKIEAEGYTVLLRFKDLYVHGYPDRVIVTTGYMINQYPETVTAFLKAFIRGQSFTRDVPKNYEYLVDLDKRMRSVATNPVEKLAALRLNIEEFAGSPNPPDCRIPIKGLELILAQEKEAGKISNSLISDEIIRLEFVERANSELSKREDFRDEYNRVHQIVTRIGY